MPHQREHEMLSIKLKSRGHKVMGGGRVWTRKSVISTLAEMATLNKTIDDGFSTVLSARVIWNNATTHQINRMLWDMGCYLSWWQRATWRSDDILLRCTEVVKKHTTTEFTGRMVRDLSMQYKS